MQLDQIALAEDFSLPLLPQLNSPNLRAASCWPLPPCEWQRLRPAALAGS